MKKVIKKIIAFLLLITIAINICPAIVHADSKNNSGDTGTVWKNIDGRKYLYNSEGKCVSTTGIDVSRWQGEIDWQQVAGDDIHFAIIRVGHGHGSNWKDTYAESFMDGCEKYGIPYGVYYYSEATTESEAVGEANNLIAALKNRNPQIGVYIDVEATDAYQAAGINPYTDGEKIVKLADIMLNMVGGAGYVPGIYANTDYFDNVLYPASHFYSAIRWVARYFDYNSNHGDSNQIPEGDWDIWQYGSTGSVAGINGNVDLDARLTEPYDRDYSDITSGVFQKEQEYADVYNYTYYIQHNPDILAAYGYNDRQGVLNHFLTFGMKEGRRASENFDVYAYMNNYIDLYQTFGDNIEEYYYHYMNFGKNEGRTADNQVTNVWKGVDYSLVFDADYYAEKRPDVIEACGNSKRALLQHFVEHGMSEGTQAISIFNPIYYREKYADLNTNYEADIKQYYYHFINFGTNEGRTGSDKFNPLVYRNNYQDLEKVYGDDWKLYYYHYLRYGVSEGRNGTEQLTNIWLGTDYSHVFDVAYYAAQRPDVVTVVGDSKEKLLYHFIMFGMDEGTQASEEFSPQIYRSRYMDLNQTYGDNWREYYFHYLNCGIREGRSAA